MLQMRVTLTQVCASGWGPRMLIRGRQSWAKRVQERGEGREQRMSSNEGREEGERGCRAEPGEEHNMGVGNGTQGRGGKGRMPINMRDVLKWGAEVGRPLQ